jgi:2-hydroxy-3-keto-5-methylthiopentenyl-1-phosphate phosphatase
VVLKIRDIFGHTGNLKKMEKKLFISIDFDGTVTHADVTDAILKTFALPGWEEIEDAWRKGLIGSKQCLSEQMSLVDASMDALVDFAGSFEPRPGFTDFLNVLTAHSIPFAIISDGFTVIIRRILERSGFNGIPVYANNLAEINGKMATSYPHSVKDCPSGTCKCRIVDKLRGGLPVIHIGDGMSDFCVAQKASLVFCRGALLAHCENTEISHYPFNDFFDITEAFNRLRFIGNASFTSEQNAVAFNKPAILKR